MTFKHPEFLYLLFAILIPVIIHFFNFRRYKKLLFSNIEFLKNVISETKKQNQLKHIILLIMRIMAIVLLVMAFSGPEFSNNREKEVSGSSLAVFYIDNSFSMMSEGVGGRLFEESVKQAGNIAEQMPRDKQFILIGNQAGSGKRVLSKEAFMAELNNVRILPANRNLSSVIRTMQSVYKEKGFESAELYLFSDFQVNAFDVENFPTDTTNAYYFIAQDLKNTQNIYIDSCWISAPVVLTNRPVTLHVRIRNTSLIEMEKIPLRVLIDGQQRAVAGFDIPAEGTKIVQVSFTVYKKGWLNGEIQIDDYPVVFDDQMYFSINAEDQVNVLEIKPDEKDSRLRSFYETEPLFNFQVMNEKQVEYNRFREFNLIILNSLTEISTGLSSQILDYLSLGRNLLVIPSENMETTNFNGFLSQINAGRVGSFDTVTTRVASINAESNLFREAIYAIPENADFPVVFKMYKYRYSISTGLVSLISLLNGHDFLLMKSFENGMVYLLAAPLQMEYTNFSTNALFVPVMFNAAIQGSSTLRLFNIISKDQVIETEIPTVTMSESPFELKNTTVDFTFIPEQQISGNKLVMNLHNGIQEPGFYNLTLNDNVFQKLAFNYNRAESKLIFHEISKLKGLLDNSEIKNFTIVGNKENSAETIVKSLESERQLWKLFIIFALLILLAEILILRFWK